MPNHCYQTVLIRGPNHLVTALHHNLMQQGRFCDAVDPMPIDLWCLEKGAEELPIYDWCLEHWGTKWDVAEIWINDKLEREKDLSWFSFECWTPWNPPIPIWSRLHRLGCDISATYQDEGGMFEGRWINGLDECWKPDPEGLDID